ncbi:hypothetical protein HYV84_00075 [Candidatus Woesearchaeota archaeon]|nr:hypothetical protein [Candidatus Woesearchaeota archaeon]
MKNKKCILGVIVIIFHIVYTYNALSYSVETPNKTVHQHIANESQKVWELTLPEMKQHLANPINNNLTSFYNDGDDIITGTGEEDALFNWLTHFWQPDSPQNGVYDDGLNSPLDMGSSYSRAMNFWKEEVFPYYVGKSESGSSHDIDQGRSYYWLGRVTHLLEDLAQPSHAILDCHPDIQGLEIFCGLSSGDGGSDDSFLEKYTGDNFLTLRATYNWTGSNFAGQQYNHENLQNMPSFNWTRVEPNSLGTFGDPTHLFRLFWYTAQKTQYFASDDVDGNSIYIALNGTQYNFSPSLWQSEGIAVVNNKSAFDGEDFYYSQSNEGSTCSSATFEECINRGLNIPCYLCNNNTGPNIVKVTNAVIPHAMKAVAGLYRLFWHTVRNELRINVPKDKDNVYKKDKVFGGVKQGGIWFTELNVSTDKTIEVRIIPSPYQGSNLTFTLSPPSGANSSLTGAADSYKLTVVNPTQGLWNITVNGNTISSSTQRFEAQAGIVRSTDAPGGVNFTDANLLYISTCSPSSGIEVVMKGTEANTSTGDTLLNISNATTTATDAFLTGLIIPNYKQIVSMYPIGSVQIDDTFSQTETARILLDADAKLKFTFYNDTTAKNQYKAIVEYLWNNMLPQSPYYNDIKTNFNSKWDRL